ncbi:carboxymuconolactone decarboxylase family protein [Actinokineospora soli]|uniref:Carboxymuconolactone decarboxylase family protein n=1 Tax=Actinokineospora soli TaxID=1048753 RepID=A0ABW2TS44_9PSEU
MKNPAMVLPDAMKGIGHLMKAAYSGGVPRLTLELLALRASQINGCAPCALGHVREATAAGATPEQLATVATWRETPFFTDADRAALALTETLTRIADTDGVPDPVWDAAAAHWDERQLAAIVLMIATLNFFNRVNVAVQERADKPSWEAA